MMTPPQYHMQLELGKTPLVCSPVIDPDSPSHLLLPSAWPTSYLVSTQAASHANHVQDQTSSLDIPKAVLELMSYLALGHQDPCDD